MDDGPDGAARRMSRALGAGRSDDADPELLDVAIEAGRCVTEFDPTALNRLTQGEMLLEREGTDREGEGDLAEAVTLLEAARADGPDGDLGTAVTVTLGFALTRWERLRAEPGAVERLTRPIELLTGSLGALGQGYISRDEVLYNLAELHTLRYVSPEFERTGADLAELDQAVEYLQGVREKDHPMVVERLASALYMRLGEAADPMDAEMGIRVLTRVARDGKDALEEQQREIFGDFLLERAKRVPTLENVEAVIEYLEEARKGSGSGTPMGLTLLQAYALRSGLAPGTLEPVIALLDETIMRRIGNRAEPGMAPHRALDRSRRDRSAGGRPGFGGRRSRVPVGASAAPEFPGQRSDTGPERGGGDPPAYETSPAVSHPSPGSSRGSPLSTRTTWWSGSIGSTRRTPRPAGRTS